MLDGRALMALTDDKQRQRFEKCTELVVVCCHATYIGKRDDWLDNESWILQSFQNADLATRKPSDVQTFIAHITAGAMLCQTKFDSVLMFSGGRTTDSDRSEAQSYDVILRDMIEQEIILGLKGRIALEENATDSYQNLLFSILRFRELTGRYPEYVTVVTHAFKERRFMELHAAAIKWPSSRLRVQGVNPPFTLAELQQVQGREYELAHKPFIDDPFGVRSPLAEKRKARNWNPSMGDGLTEDESVRQLLRWDGGASGQEPFPGRLPWVDE